MTPTSSPASHHSADTDDAAATRPADVLVEARELARNAAVEEAGGEVGAHVGVEAEDDVTATHLFEAAHPGYGGWRWAVTVAVVGSGEPVTVSEVVLLPGPSSLVAPDWVPWNQRVRAGDLGPGDLLPTAPDDPRLAPGYLLNDDPGEQEVAYEIGLGRPRVLSREGRLDAADRWHRGEFGPASDMAKAAPGNCGNCGFFLQLQGSLKAAFGVCANELAPADGRVVHTQYGCGAHSEAEVDTSSIVPISEVVYDDSVLDIDHTPRGGELPSTETEPETEPEASTEAEPEPQAEDTPEPEAEAPAPPATES
ncbi:DUF3027 domain-containing protein [Allokutzneria sp. A3M-2-11 16]|uniref:DUF3027 domain-containing protein n=1 Tax=Allokutzneria sp. A3M-2-11 16 TaxID=2962043 RepID=UPI0027E2316B|nr:DUF3027 domain-containing protein [Allokutzneria sp. A3M-2-11 16]